MKTSSGRFAVMRESSWRTEPAAQLRGLAKSGSPSAVRSSLICSNAFRER